MSFDGIQFSATLVKMRWRINIRRSRTCILYHWDHDCCNRMPYNM